MKISSPPSYLLFLVLFLQPATLVFATGLSFNLQTIAYFLAFLIQHYHSRYTISLSQFPCILLLFLAGYATFFSVIHIVLVLLLSQGILSITSISEETALSLAVPQYDQSIWKGSRILISHVSVLISTLLVFSARVPRGNRYAGSSFLLAWFHRRRRNVAKIVSPRTRSHIFHKMTTRRHTRKDEALPYFSESGRNEKTVFFQRKKRGSRTLSELYPNSTLKNLGSTNRRSDKNIKATPNGDDEDSLNIIQPHNCLSERKNLNRFTAYMIGRGGLFWSCLAISSVATSYSSVSTLIFLLAYYSVVLSWAFHITWFHPMKSTSRFITIIQTFRWYVIIYLTSLVLFQVPWFQRWSQAEIQNSSVGMTLKFLGLVSIDSNKSNGWTAIMAFGGATSTYIFTGMVQGAIKSAQKIRRLGKSDSELFELPSKSSVSRDNFYTYPQKEQRTTLSYYEQQFLLVVKHASSLGLLAWALVFPGILTVPFLVGSLIYLNFRHLRNSRLYNYLVVYAVLLQMVHFLLMAATDSFGSSFHINSAITRILGLTSLNSQFSVNFIESVSIGLLCVSISNKSLDAEQTKKDIYSSVLPYKLRNSTEDQNVFHHAEKKPRKRELESLYSPLRICIDQFALSSLYVAGGLDMTVLNSVFLVGLSVICLLQSFGLFRTPKILLIVWKILMLYAVVFLTVTGTFCRAFDDVWKCELRFGGIKMADWGQLVAYAVTAVLSSIQVTFTWSLGSHKSHDIEPDMKYFEQKFWIFIRKYFLYFTYFSLLVYPLMFPANFLSYGYVLFLFISILAELIIPSVKDKNLGARDLLKKFWILVILYSMGATLARYFVRLKWFDRQVTMQRWVFGLLKNDTRSFIITVGDALVLIIVSLQGRIFVVDSLISNSKSEKSIMRLIAFLSNRPVNIDNLSDPVVAKHSLQSSASIRDTFRRHRRSKSAEEMHRTQKLTALFPEDKITVPYCNEGSGLQADKHERLDVDIRYLYSSHESTKSLKDDDERSEKVPDPAQEDQRNELQKVLNGKRLEQAAAMIKILMRSEPIKQAEKLFQEVCYRIMETSQRFMLHHGYILQATAILAASIWLLGISFFGLFYLLFGCVILLSNQAPQKNCTASKRTALKNSMAKTSGILVIASFSLMSAQYIFLMNSYIAEPMNEHVRDFIGFQVANTESDLPISVKAIVAHLLVFITAIFQTVAIRKSKNHLQNTEEVELRLKRDIREVGDRNENEFVHYYVQENDFSVLGRKDVQKQYEATRVNYTDDLSHGESNSTTGSSSSCMLNCRENFQSTNEVQNGLLWAPSKSKDNPDKDAIETFFASMQQTFRSFYYKLEAVFSLLHPLWLNWGFDLTYLLLLICGLITPNIFSMVYLGVFALFSGIRKEKVQNRWHQISLLLVLITVSQYAVILAFKVFQSTDSSSVTQSEWKQWFLLQGANNSVEKDLPMTIAIASIICSSITLNSISEGHRNLHYWSQKLSRKSVGESCSSSCEKVQNERLFSQEMMTCEISKLRRNQFLGSYEYGEEQQLTVGKNLDGSEENIGSVSVHSKRGGEQQIFQSSSQFKITSGNVESHFIRRNRSEEPDHDVFANNILGLASRNSMNSVSEQVQDLFVDRTDEHDFIRHPIPVRFSVKTFWMRFAGPIIQLYLFAVATVDTNIISACLLVTAFSFLFQFTNVTAKRKRFLKMRWFVICAILSITAFQAPFQGSELKWENVLGLFKISTPRGRKFSILIVSLWIFCQILCRVYESDDFLIVQKYGEEDAKVRFKRAVHEHNGRKYEKMLARNKAKRSNYARHTRLNRLKVLKKSEKTVQAFYKVCVEEEIDLIRKTSESLQDGTEKYFFPRQILEEKNGKKADNGWHVRLLRKVLRGKRWKEFGSLSISSEIKSFAFRYSAAPVYSAMILAAIMNPSFTTMAYPIVTFLYLIVEQPRPHKSAWTAIMLYVCVLIAMKYVIRSPEIPLCSDVPFFTAGKIEKPIPKNIFNCSFANGIGFDIFVLLSLLGHRAILYSRGLWDLTMSEEDMVLRQEIYGREVDMFTEINNFDENGCTFVSCDQLPLDSIIRLEESEGDCSKSKRPRETIWAAKKQCDDVDHILLQSRQVMARSLHSGISESKILTHSLADNVAKSDTSTLSAKLVTPQGLDQDRGKLNGQKGSENFPCQELGNKIQPTGSSLWVRTISTDQEHGITTNRETESQIENDGLTVRKSSPGSKSCLETVKCHPRFQGTSMKSESPADIESSTPLRRGVKNNLNSSEEKGIAPMTAGESRVQTSLIQGKIIPEQPHLVEKNTLSLFQNQKQGARSSIHNYFRRLTRENDHKAVGDYYILIFVVDFISFVYVMFGFSSIFGNSTEARQQTWWTTNFIETRHLITLFIMFSMIVLDRVFYLTKNITGKIVLQFFSVLVYHTIFFIISNTVGNRNYTRLFYVLRCIYFMLSGLQIRAGFPAYTTAQFLLRNYSTFGLVIFEIYVFVPFLWLTRTLLDWAVLPTTLEIFQYFRFVDIHLWLYRNRAVNESRGSFRRKLGDKRGIFPRIYQGFGLFTLCVVALFAPFIIFSIFNPFFVQREIREAIIKLNLILFEENSTWGGARSYPLFSRTSVASNALNTSERNIVQEQLGVRLDIRERERLFEARFSTVSDTTWNPADEDKAYIVSFLRSLKKKNHTSNSFPLKISFHMLALTSKRQTFGTEPRDVSISKYVAMELLKALEKNENFAIKLLSPLPVYSILQPRSSIFESYTSKGTQREVCIRLLQNLPAFWTMSDCNSCVCSKDPKSLESESEIRQVLQVADISALQVGGATILTLYTVILFSLANLLKRMFIDKRLIIPYIDMPYTLHLHQLVLDIMYARQDNELEMEEILYNGLIDIYRDQRELVRWTGERALKTPEVWWSDSNVENPFMIYPSFVSTDTEPYFNRSVE